MSAETPVNASNAGSPIVRRASSASPNHEPRDQVAWQREMERAQLSTWFKPPIATRADAAAAASSSAPPQPSRHVARAVVSVQVASTGAGLPAMVAAPLASMAANVSASEASALGGLADLSKAPTQPFFALRAISLVEAAPDAPVATDAQIRRAGGPMRVVNEPVPEGTADARTEAAEESWLPTASSTEAQAPVRLHEEATPEGQAVWIAMRADDKALAAMLPRIVSDLQHDLQHARGQRLFQVVCNGRLVWRDGRVVAAGYSVVPDGERHPGTVFDSFQSKGA